MRLQLIPLVLLATVTAAHAQRAGGSAASQMAGRASANAGQVQGAVSGGVTSLYVLQNDAPSDTRRSTSENEPAKVEDTSPQDPFVLGAPGTPLASSFTNPALRGQPATFPPLPPSPLRTQVPAFGTTGVPAFHSGR